MAEPASGKWYKDAIAAIAGECLAHADQYTIGSRETNVRSAAVLMQCHVYSISF